MPEKKKSYVKFEGIIVPSSSGEVLAETDKAWLVKISIPEKYSGEQIWIAKSMVKPNIKVSGDLIQGSVESWIFKKLDKKETITVIPKEEVVEVIARSEHESAQTEVEVIQPARDGTTNYDYSKLTPDPIIMELLKINIKMDKIIKLLEER